MTRRWLISMVLGWSAIATAQKSPQFRSTEIRDDHTVVFRYFDPRASRVDLVLENRAAWIPMQRDSTGVWSVTTGPLKPEIYGYRFALNGSPRTVHDPQNSTRRYGNDLLLVPGSPPELWEDAGSPKGKVERHTYISKAVAGLPGGKNEFVVYTPPGYDPKAKPYPVLYLLHVWGDQADSWVDFAQANLILDNLIAQGKVHPMIAVMPLGYGDMRLVDNYDLGQDPKFVKHNLQLFEQALLTEVMPQVEAAYNVRRDADGRAILGASMGGQESMVVGLNHPELFAWVGGESAALQTLDLDTILAPFLIANRQPRLIWMVCAKDEELLESNRKMAAWLKAHGRPVTLDEPDGTHSYIVWREGLIRFAQKIFPTGG